MINKLKSVIDLDQNQWLFVILSSFILLSIFIATLIENIFIMVAPLAIITIYIALVNYKFLFGLFLFLIPFSIEINVTDSLGLVLPAEPFMMFFSLVFVMMLIHNIRHLSLDYFKHPITIILILHICWIAISCVSAVDPVIGVKYLLAKIWFVLPFYFLPIFLFRDKKDLKFLVTILTAGLCLSVIWVLIQHAGMGFSFKEVNNAVKPFFRNHVNYASILVLFLPFICALFFQNRNENKSGFVVFSIIILFIIAIYLTYTRAAIISMFIGFAAYFIIRWKFVKMALITTAVASVIGLGYLLKNNEYMEYAPEFEKTVTHTKFNTLVEATTKLEDISTMERVYRWLAGYYMIKEKPILGFGPGNFYTSYQAFTVTRFQTYISNNLDRSGIHCYYLMVFVEQGIIGFLIFLLLCIIILLKGEQVYHQTKDFFYKKMVMAATVSIIIILAILLINDMLEALKVGTFFFLFASIIMMVDVRNKLQQLG